MNTAYCCLILLGKLVQKIVFGDLRVSEQQVSNTIKILNKLVTRKKSVIIHIYILGVFTKKLYSKPLECNVVYIQIITLRHMTSHDFK